MRVYQVNFYGLTLGQDGCVDNRHQSFYRSLAEAKAEANAGLRSELRYLQASRGINSWKEISYGEPTVCIYQVELKPLSKGVAIAMLNRDILLPECWLNESTPHDARSGWEEGDPKLIWSWSPEYKWERYGD